MRPGAGAPRNAAAFKELVGFSAEQFGLSIPEMVKLYEALPLKEAVVEKWLYGNAKRFLRLH